MIRLIYLSSAVEPLTSAQLADILGACRRHNAKGGITGVLLYHDGCFIQLLEGPEAAMRSCFERIKADRRHRNLLVVTEDEVDAPVFGDWTMGFARPGDLADVEEGAVRHIMDVCKEVAALSSKDTRIEPIFRAYMNGFRDLPGMPAPKKPASADQA